MTFENFVTDSQVKKNLINNPGARKVFNLLSQPHIIFECITFSNHRLPALTGIARTLEDSFSHDPSFPLTSYLNRQYVGKMVKYILNFYGFSTIEAKLSEKQIRKFAKASLFKTSQVYQKTHDAQLEIVVTSKQVKNS